MAQVGGWLPDRRARGWACDNVQGSAEASAHTATRTIAWFRRVPDGLSLGRCPPHSPAPNPLGRAITPPRACGQHTSMSPVPFTQHTAGPGLHGARAVSALRKPRPNSWGSVVPTKPLGLAAVSLCLSACQTPVHPAKPSSIRTETSKSP